MSLVYVLLFFWADSVRNVHLKTNRKSAAEVETESLRKKRIKTTQNDMYNRLEVTKVGGVA